MFPRDIYPALKKHLAVKQVTVLTGMRRTGKTTIVQSLLQDAPSSNTLYLDLERLDNRTLFDEQNYDAVMFAFAERGLATNQKMYVALDEIQHAPKAPSVIKYLYDTYDIKFIVTGSSSYYLKNLFSESLAGRKKIFELSTLDFGEFLLFKGLSVKQTEQFQEANFRASQYSRLKWYYEEFVAYGGFPEVVLSDSPEVKRNLLLDIVSSYINIDVKTLSDVRNADALVNLMRMLAIRTGTKLDLSKLSRLTGLSRPTVTSYVSFLEKTYIIHLIPVHSRNPDREIVKARKIYFMDNGLLISLAQVGSGSLFENAVFNQLRHHGKVAYYAKKTGEEIDFILNANLALEVKESPTAYNEHRLNLLAKQAGALKARLVGRHMVPKFNKYIWGGQIR